MFFYSFVVFLFLSCIRRLRNETLYPHLENHLHETTTKKRAEIRKKRGEEARRLAAKLE